MPSNIDWRFERIEGSIRDDHKLLDEVDGLARKHELEFHGERGVYKAIEELAHQMMWVNRALWTIALAVIGAAAGIIFGGQP